MKGKNNILKNEIINTIFVLILGIIFHYIYEWSNENIFIGIISPINESIWEHLKLIFFPMLILTIIGKKFEGKDIENYICSKAKGIYIAMIFVVIVYYTYSGILGKNIDFVNIIIFFIAVIIGQYFSYKNIIKGTKCNKSMTILLIISTFLIFVIFSFTPPKINFFKDPVNGSYGIEKSKI